MNERTLDEKIETLRGWIKEAERIVFFGGAGVSTESGVPDFRSKNGLYNQRDVRFDAYSPEYLLSHDCLADHPEVFFEFYRQKMDARSARPNAAHRYLARLEQEGKLTAVITQNIDGLHQKAGSRNVLELHGSTERNYCMRCKKRFPPDFIFNCPDPVPRCPCGGTVRCDVTLYGEALPEGVPEAACRALAAADLVIVGGTSLSVYPAAGFLSYASCARHRAVVNRDPLPAFGFRPGDLEITADIGAVFARL